MMKDLADSKRLFNTIKAMPNSVRSPVRGQRSGPNRGTGPVAATIVSALFWPPLQEEELKLPEEVSWQTLTLYVLKPNNKRKGGEVSPYSGRPSKRKS